MKKFEDWAYSDAGQAVTALIGFAVLLSWLLELYWITVPLLLGFMLFVVVLTLATDHNENKH